MIDFYQFIVTVLKQTLCKHDFYCVSPDGSGKNVFKCKKCGRYEILK